MDLFPFLRGLVIGFALAAPIGPVGVLCIRKALADGKFAAFVAGLGAAIADTVYGAVAGHGLTYVADLLSDHQMPLRLIGGVFLCYLAWRTWTAPPILALTPRKGAGLAKDFSSTFLITLTNPATIFAFMGVFAAMGAIEPAEGSAAALIVGVFVGSALWWLTLSTLVGAIRSRFTPRSLDWMNCGSAVMLALFGLAVLVSLLF